MYAYAFEAKSIQSYLLKGGKLRDIVGASDLLDCACDAADGSGSLLDSVCTAVGINDDCFTRRAAAALIMVHADDCKLKQFRALWTLAFQLHLPGMEFADALVKGVDASDATARVTGALTDASGPAITLPIARNIHAPLLPLAGPLTLLAPRTGGAAIERSLIDYQAVDEATNRRRNKALTESKVVGRRLAARFEPEAMRTDAKTYVWPANLDPAEAGLDEDDQTFLALGDNAYIGIVHLDGTGFGQILIRLREKLRGQPDGGKILRAFSATIGDAMREAVQTAVSTQLKDCALRRRTKDRHVIHVLPARPIVLAGDDLTIIVRGDLAIDFTEAVIQVFRTSTKTRLPALWKMFGLEDAGLGDCLSAGAGIAFVKAKQPYDQAYRLAEQLAAYAKTVAKDIPGRSDPPAGVIAFHRMTTSVFDDYTSVIRKRELSMELDKKASMELDKKTMRLTACPYSVEAAARGLPRLSALRELKTLISEDQIAHGPLRHLADLFKGDAEGAVTRWNRFVEVMKEPLQGETAAAESFRALLDCLAALGCDTAGPGLAVLFGNGATPIADAMNWHMVSRGS